MDLLEKLPALEEKFHNLEAALTDPEVLKDRRRLAQLARERQELEPVINAFKKYAALRNQIAEDEELLKSDDPEMKQLAKEELEELRQECEKQEQALKLMLVPRDPADNGNAILEIRAGTGGEEATLFAGDLLRMYRRFAERQGWNMETLSLSPSEVGGIKEVIMLVKGKQAYGRLKYESGVHRVQRVPETESAGRIHTSAATVAVLPEAEEVDVEIKPEDLRIDTFRASGAGGQHVNKTDSAIRITHLPTGLVVSCQDEKSQHKNKEKALKVLRARLLDRKRQEQAQEIAELRRSMVSTGDRSAKIRTYNFPQGRVTDHRINLTLYRLEEILDGDLEPLVEPLIQADLLARLESA